MATYVESTPEVDVEAEVFEMLTKLDNECLVSAIIRLDIQHDKGHRYSKSQLLKMIYGHLCSDIFENDPSRIPILLELKDGLSRLLTPFDADIFSKTYLKFTEDATSSPNRTFAPQNPFSPEKEFGLNGFPMSVPTPQNPFTSTKVAPKVQTPSLNPFSESLRDVVRRELKISGKVGLPGQKDRLNFSSLIYQISQAQRRNYTETEICDAVIKSISPELPLRSYLEGKMNLNLRNLNKVLRSYF